MWKVEFHVEAEEELGEATDYYAGQNLRVALAFQAEVRAGVVSIASDPSRLPTLGSERHFYLLKQFPYLLVYRILDDFVEVLAVAHTSRRPGYWNSRT
jgi:toxin ParE1/3/4